MEERYVLAFPSSVDRCAGCDLPGYDLRLVRRVVTRADRTAQPCAYFYRSAGRRHQRPPACRNPATDQRSYPNRRHSWSNARRIANRRAFRQPHHHSGRSPGPLRRHRAA